MESAGAVGMNPAVAVFVKAVRLLDSSDCELGIVRARETFNSYAGMVSGFRSGMGSRGNNSGMSLHAVTEESYNRAIKGVTRFDANRLLPHERRMLIAVLLQRAGWYCPELYCTVLYLPVL